MVGNNEESHWKNIKGQSILDDEGFLEELSLYLKEKSG